MPQISPVSYEFITATTDDVKQQEQEISLLREENLQLKNTVDDLTLALLEVLA